ncbi:hypothetical protein JX265_009822 [Neoarthrinium moseri]|uniref:Ubiquitin 3 binding protein But2 C-terminal domain-containing protein n=1 Tax=Neoarthrinium moseri TaxID=1658444 RepID=A0A9P9WF82_9PEZI|nr:uncharacterized protein JN550_005425 [Neoarthrinium moseri]KAI1860423.1 hypothetical protein JX265_009822 [Neoarthrinium moseri]KAI1869835.1 hypothetical protein JN550_005425 [Neoarthrinium moseri]
MKTFAVAAILISAVAARSTPIRARQETEPKHIILPSALASHDVNKGNNELASITNTTRVKGTELSTLYSVTFDESLVGLTCVGQFVSGHDTDFALGSRQLDFFSTQIQDLNKQANGNLRNQAFGRITFVAVGQEFDIDRSVPAPFADSFPCPVSKTIVLESVAVGDFDSVVIGQDFAGAWTPGGGKPNGLSFAAY